MFIESQKIITIVTDTNTPEDLTPKVQKKMLAESQKIITIVTDSDTSGVLYPIPQKKMDEKKVNVSQNRIFPLGDFLGIKVFNPKDSFDTLQSYDN